MQSTVKDRIFDHIPPAMLVAVTCFWALAPEAVLESPWTLAVVSPLIIITVQLLEFVHERHQGWRLNRQEFFTDLFYVTLNATVIGWCVQVFADEPLTALKASLGLKSEWLQQMPWLFQAALVLFLIEFGQYWMHRLMHNWTPFWLTHAPHHHITQLNAGKGAVGNPIELFLISLSVVALLDFEPTAVLAGYSAITVITVFAHANVRSNPPIWYSFFFTTIRHHSLHHSTDYESTRCNYANSLIIIDRVLGTYREGEAAVVGQDDLRRLSIREQFLFPFKSIIDAYRARRSGETDATATV